MRKVFSPNSFVTWILLLTTTGALAAGLQEGVTNMQKAEFFPVAAFAVTLAYLLGFSKWSARRAWLVIGLGGLALIIIECAQLFEPFKTIISAMPRFELDYLQWLFQKKDAKIPFPETAVFQAQFTQIASNFSTLIRHLFGGMLTDLSVREFIWDMPILLLAAWAGWCASRRRQILLALMPALTLHAGVLYLTNKNAFSLQINAFALIMLLGVHQTQKFIPQENESAKKAVRETQSALFILSFFIALIAGFMPNISVRGAVQKLTQNGLAKSLGLERQVPLMPAYVTNKLPREHLIGEDPSRSKQIVFTVKTGELEPLESGRMREKVPRHYWRWLTYDMYNGNGWTTSPAEESAYSAGSAIQPVEPRYRVIHLRVEKSSAEDNRLYWTGALIAASQPFNVNWRIAPNETSLITDMLGATTKEQNYQADSMVPLLGANELRASPAKYPKEIQRYLQLPQSVPPRVKKLSSELTGNFTNPYDKAKAIETYLRAYPYSLEIPPPPAKHDIADYFLFDLKTGYCDYYATSMIVLARAAGIPARLVIGYASGSYDPKNAKYTIREEYAHSWVEIYFTGFGWVEFEPTANQPTLNLPNELPKETSLNSKVRVWSGATGYATDSFLSNHFFLISTVSAMMIILCVFVLLLYSQGYLKPHRTIHSIYQYVFLHGKKLHTGASPSETPSAFAERLTASLQTGQRWLIPAQSEITFLTNLYLQEIYSSHPTAKNELDAALKTWRKLFWRLLYARTVATLQRVKSRFKDQDAPRPGVYNH